ncbi:MAG: restriction endonuclease [Rhodoblastus sp.]|nr:hypothetical protein [Amphiplicatus sp.]MCB1534689.1 restriction endonuclease [Rhodoblastus sp.]
MKFEFEEAQATYSSESQNARALTESWVRSWAFCPNCGSPQLQRFQNNRPVADFFCGDCNEQYELKSQKGKFGPRIVDGAYKTMIDRLNASDNPNLMLLSYGRETGVSDLVVIPKQFFVPAIIEERKPLAPAARRAGWIGCNILLRDIPNAGKIFVVRNRETQSVEDVRHQWRRSLFLRNERINARGWLLAVMKCVEMIGKSEFTLQEVYAYESYVQSLYPGNQHTREKIRQQLQVLRDEGVLLFLGGGRYRLANAP